VAQDGGWGGFEGLGPLARPTRLTSSAGQSVTQILRRRSVDLRQGWLRDFLLKLITVLGRAECGKMPGRPWTEDEIRRARGMYAAGHFYGEIDKALGRRVGTIRRRLEGLARSVKSSRIPVGLVVEREALTAARTQRTLTQDFCGDPPPGFSALHGKTGLR